MELDTNVERVVFFAVGFASCLVAFWLHRLFTNWIFGSGLLPGQAKIPGKGHYVQLSRGHVHYVFLDKVTTESPMGREHRSGSDFSQETAMTMTTELQASVASESVLPEDTLHVPLVDHYSGSVLLGKRLEYGQIHGELVVIVHGYAGSNDAFVNENRSGYAQWLNNNGYSVLAFDLYGFGHSDGPDTTYSSELFVEQLAELCLVFGIVKPFDLIGFSMGGSVALQFAYRYEHLVKRLILQAPHIVEAPLRPSLQFALRIPFFREILSSFIIPRIGECGNNRAALRASFRLLMTRLRGGGRWSSPGKGGSTKEMLAEIDKSGRVVHLLWGRKDSVVHWSQTKKVHKLAPRSKIVTHPTADHMCFADGPLDTREFFRNAILHFLHEPHWVLDD